MGKLRMPSWLKKSGNVKKSQVSPQQHNPTTPQNESDDTVPLPQSTDDSASQTTSPAECSEPQDLWGIAFGKLDEGQQAILSEIKSKLNSPDEQDHTKTEVAVDEVVRLTKDRYKKFQVKADGKLHQSSKKILNAALSFKEIIGAAAGLDPTQHAASVWAIVSIGLKMTENYQDRRATLFESSDYLADTLAQCASIEQSFYRAPNVDDKKDMGEALVRLYVALLRYTVQIHQDLNASRTRRLLDSVSDATDIPLTELKRSVDTELQGLHGRIHLGQHLKRGNEAEKILSEIDRIAKYLQRTMEPLHIEKLPMAHDALYDSYADQNEDYCLQGTREELLRLISQWAESQNEFMFCLKGMAGTGKSTVSRTIAQDLQRRGLLAATFFFKRGQADRGNASQFMSTIARQLIIGYPALSPDILDAAKKEPNIATKHLGEQFEQLLYRPLSKYRPEGVQNMVIVIDALDECEGENGIEIILNQLFRLQEIETLPLRVLLTARPELDIRRGLRMKDYRNLVLNELPVPVIEDDIRLFFRHKLAQIRLDEECPLGTETVNDDWPRDYQIEQLVQMATPLFILATTICRFIGERDLDPEERLQEFLDYPSTASENQMDRLYLPVLNQLLVGATKEETEKHRLQFQDTVGVIILLADPLSMNSLSKLINLPVGKVSRGLRRFHSVLSVPADALTPIRTLHTSFRDFLLRTDSPFHVDEKGTHGIIASHCLRVMSSGLKHNICGLPSYGTELQNVEQATVDHHIHAELRYACCFWVYHLQRSKDYIAESDVLSFLEAEILHWLEALALMGRISEAIGMIETLKTEFKMPAGSKLSKFLQDAERFNLQITHIAGRAPLQIYASGLVFAPSDSIVKRKFLNEKPPQIQSFPVVAKTWSANRQTLEGHIDIVESLAFSANGHTLASRSRDGTIRIWDTVTGANKQTLSLPPPNTLFIDMAFSDDGNTLFVGTETWLHRWDLITDILGEALTLHRSFFPSVSTATTSNGHKLARGSWEGELEVIDADTGLLCHKFKAHSKSVSSLAYSPDGLLLISGSRDSAIRIWDAVNGHLLKTLKDHSSEITSLACSPDGQTLASGSYDATIHLWDLSNWTLVKTFTGHKKSINSLAFSPDGLNLASGSQDYRIMLWDMVEKKPARIVGGQSLVDSVTAVAFSPDNQSLASGTYRGVIQLWNTSEDGHERISSDSSAMITVVNFSLDGNALTSGSNDGSIKIWNTSDGRLEHTFQNPSGSHSAVTSIAMSHDGLKLASAHEDKTIIIWEAATGKIQHSFDGDPGAWGDFESLVFSPNGKLLASSSREAYLALLGDIGDRTVKLWDMTTSALVQTFSSPCAVSLTSNTVVFSPCGQMLAILFEEHQKSTIELRGIDTGTLQQTFHYPWAKDDRINSLAFSPDSEGLSLTFVGDTGFFYQPLGVHPDPANSKLTKIANSPARFSFTNGWIALGDENLLWVPAEYGGSLNIHSVVKDSMIAFGLRNGRTSIIGFDLGGSDARNKS